MCQFNRCLSARPVRPILLTTPRRTPLKASQLLDADWNHWPDGPEPDAIARTVAQEGFAGIEIGVYRSGVELSADRCEALWALPDAHGLRVGMVLYSLPAERWPRGALSCPDAADDVVAESRRIAAIAATFELRVIGLWPGADVVGADRDAFVDGLRRAVAAAAASGVTLAVEPKPGTLVADSQQARELCEAIDGLAVLLDTGHAFSGGEDPAASIRALADRLHHVHLGDADPGKPDDDLPCGRRHDFGAVVAALDEIGYAGAATLDLYGFTSSGGATGAEAARESRAHLATAGWDVS